eukprot:TRINITY_DN3126_c0_g1_i1.p1 TRINITY_DN3126_c0_g1~~TRINITY_DN3126_c0_g1_i1.p1  ORF type:complete len:867 (-),score=252.09 TRINITY_DN3126_c0_g1_i1:54-2654(-)
MTDRVLLPTNVTPSHYRVHLTPNFETFKFDGKVDVQVSVKEATKTVVVNTLDLEILSASISYESGNQTGTTAIDTENEALTITFDNEVPVGAATLTITFIGVLNDKLCGFYRSKNVIGEEVEWIATTQFEPADARMAFPCWDEPAIKATFSIVLTAPKNLVALSNMPAISETEEGDLKTTEFSVTPIVSTYLVAFCVGNFECVEGKSSTNTPYRVWTTKGKKEMGRFALDVGVKVLSYFEEYYGVPYPLPKTDMIAIPDFSAGAMENWGLITYRETALLCNQETASVGAKSRIAYVVSHELAHQWFGNLVTMEWWKELWLNEGFATFVGTQAVAQFFPEWQVWKQFISDYIFRAFKVDSLRNSHPIEVDVSKARDINEIFDAISYCKGASVIRMVSNYLGEEAFRKGLNIYLNRFKYSNAVTSDLWQALSEGSGKDVNSVMNAWVSNMGFPVVSITETDKPGQYEVSQRRFFSFGEPTPEEDTTVWTINLGVCSSKNPEKISYLDVNQKSQQVTYSEEDASTEWVKFNAGQSGFYRVQYSPALAERVAASVKSGALPAEDRLGLVEDAFALALSGATSLVQALALTASYTNEDDYVVWSTISENIGTVGNLLSGEPAAAYLDKYVTTLYSKIGTLGWDSKSGESDLTKLLRARVLATLGGHGDTAIVEEAKKRFATFADDFSSLSADLAGVVFTLAVKFGGEEAVETMISIYEKMHKSSDVAPDLRIKALTAIGFGSTPALIEKALHYAFESDCVRTQDLFYPIFACSQSHYGREATWSFLKTNWDTLLKKLESSNFLLGRIISYATSGFSSEEKLKDVEEFFSTRKVAGTERTIAQSIESIKANSAALANNKESVTAWLKEHYSA